MNKFNQPCTMVALLAANLFIFVQPLVAEFFADFEAGEGFRANHSPNVVSSGWEGSSATNVGSAENLYVTSAQAFSGGCSLAMHNGADQHYLTMNSGSLYDLGATEVSFYLKNPTTTFESGAFIARFDVYYAASSRELPGRRVAFGLQFGESEADPLRVLYSQTGLLRDGLATLSDLSPTVLDDWTRVTVKFDFLSEVKTVKLSVDGVDSSFAGLLASVADERSRISRVRFNASTSGTGISYVDGISVVIPLLSSPRR